MIKLYYIGIDDWSRPVYKDETGRIWKDVNLGSGVPDLYRSSNNEIDGEPDYPINSEYEFVTKYEENPHRFTYMMLDRLRSDCDYYLGCGRRYEGHINGKNGINTIAKMKELWNSLPLDGKPEWLTLEDIAEYEQEMLHPSGKFIDPYAWGEYRRNRKIDKE